MHPANSTGYLKKHHVRFSLKRLAEFFNALPFRGTLTLTFQNSVDAGLRWGWNHRCNTDAGLHTAHWKAQGDLRDWAAFDNCEAWSMPCVTCVSKLSGLPELARRHYLLCQHEWRNKTQGRILNSTYTQRAKMQRVSSVKLAYANINGLGNGVAESEWYIKVKIQKFN